MKTPIVFRLSIIVLFVGAVVTPSRSIAITDGKLGSLTCSRIAGTGKNRLIFSSAQVRCIFKGDGGAEQWYIGETGIKLGLDLKFKGNETLRFAVVSATDSFVPEGAFLTGKYSGGQASAALGLGVGVQVLLGGSNDTMALQPAVETSKGSSGISAGIGFLNIDPDPLTRARTVTPHGTLYTQTMYSGYFSHAFDHYHFTEPDYAGSDYFSERAIAAAGGLAPAPASAPAGDGAAVRERLVSALARYLVAEVDAAKAQVAYDCWMYGIANNHDREVGQCRAAFLNHVDKVETAAVEVEALEVLVMIPMSRRILFDTDVSDIDGNAVPVIAELSKRLSLLSDAKIYVAGHADKPGTPQYNLTLSEKRAASTIAALIKAGIPKASIAAEAFGSAEPIGNNPYDALNRRVDVVIEPIAVNPEALIRETQRLNAIE